MKQIIDDKSLIGILDSKNYRSTITTADLNDLLHNIRAVSDVNHAILLTQAYCKYSTTQAGQKALQQWYTNLAGVTAIYPNKDLIVRLSQKQLAQIVKIYSDVPKIDISTDDTEKIEIPVHDYSIKNKVLYLGPMAYNYLLQKHPDSIQELKKY